MESLGSETDLLFKFEPDDRLVGLVICLFVCLFVIVSEVIQYASERCVILRMTSQFRWRNLAVSWVHAIFCTVGIMYCYVIYGHHYQSMTDVNDLNPLSSYMLVAFSTGYFLYDMLDHCRNGQLATQWEVIAHHIVVLSIFGYNLANHQCIAFSVVALTVEINSVFLHGRKLLQMFNIPFSHWSYRTTVILNFLTFIIFRIFTLAILCAGLLLNGHKYTMVYNVLLGVALSFMVILNPILFWRLLKNDVLRQRRKKNLKEKENELDKQETSQSPVLSEKNGHGRKVNEFYEDGDSKTRGRGENNVLNRAKAS